MDFVWGIIPLAVIAIALWKLDSKPQQNGNSNEEKINY